MKDVNIGTVAYGKDWSGDPKGYSEGTAPMYHSSKYSESESLLPASMLAGQLSKGDKISRIKFIGTGEKMEAIDVFHPARMADRILRMGDVVSLVERAQEQFDLEEAKKLEKKIRKNQFDFNDFYNQIQQIKKMGNIKDLAAMIPGVGKAIRDVDIPEDAFKGIEAIILSMTPKERTNPAILNTSRRQRIAKGSGTNIQEVNKLIKQFDQTRKMMQMMTGNKMAQMMSRMKGMPGMPKMPGM